MSDQLHMLPTSPQKVQRVSIEGGGASDGAIVDGDSSSIKASVLDYTNSNPLAVRLTDTAGDYVGAGAGTQYTEDAAAAANPTGTVSILVRKDTPAALTTTDGDNVAQRGTDYGAAYVQLVTSAGAFIDSVGGGTEYTEDIATANPQVGKAIMMERDDSLSAVTPIEGDWIGLRGTAEGALWIQDFNSDAILSDTTAIKTAVEILDNTVSGSEMQVDVVAALPAGTNAIGKLAANSGVDIGDVDVASLPSTVHSADFDTGVGTDTTLAFGIAVPASGGAVVVPGDATAGLKVDLGADNDVTVTGTVTANLSATDNAVLDAIEADTTTIAGAVAGTEMQVDVLTMPTVTVTATNLDVQSGGADLATSTQAGAIQTAVELIDDSVATLGTTTYTEASSKGLVIGAVRRDADTTLVDTTNEVSPLQVDASGRLKVEAFSGETLPVSLTSTTITGTVAVTQSGTWDEVGINDSGNSITVDNGGTFAVQATAVGTIADDATTPGAPVMIGGQAKSPDGTDPGSVSAEDDVARVFTDLNRRMLVNDEHPRWWSYHSDGSTALTDASVAADPGDGFQLVITDIQFSNGSTTAMNMFLEEGVSKIWGPVYLEAVNGRGYVWKGKKHVTASTALTVTTSAAAAHSVEILGYIQAV